MANKLIVASYQWFAVTILVTMTLLLSHPYMVTSAEEHGSMSQSGQGGIERLPMCSQSALYSSGCDRDDEDCDKFLGSALDSAEMETMARVMQGRPCRFENNSLGVIPGSGDVSGHRNDGMTNMSRSGHGMHRPTEGSNKINTRSDDDPEMHRTNPTVHGANDHLNPHNQLPHDISTGHHHGSHRPNLDVHGAGTDSNPHHSSSHQKNKHNSHHGSHHGRHHGDRNMTSTQTEKDDDDRTGLAIAISVGAFHFILTILIIIFFFCRKQAAVNEKDGVVDKTEPITTAIPLGGRHKPSATVMPSPTSVKCPPENDYSEVPVSTAGAEKEANAIPDKIQMDA